MKKILFITFLFFLGLKTALAQGIAVEAFVDRPTVSLDDQVVLTIRVKGGSVFTEPQIPNRGNFDVISRGSSSRVEMINGRLSMAKEFTYILAPRRVGQHEIGPVSVFVEGVEYKAGPITVSVVGSEPGPSSPPSQPGMPSFPQWGAPFPGSPPTSPEGQYKDVFVTAEVDNKNPYKGEQIVFTFRLYTSRNVNSAKLDLPDFHDFWSEEIVKENKYYKELGGKRYVVNEFKMALFPTQSGPLKIGETTLRAEVEEPLMNRDPFNDPFFGSQMRGLNFRPRVFKAPEMMVEVKDLPAGAPADFNGLVGNFNLEGKLSKKELTVGETATLTLTVSGAGNIKDAQLSPNFQIPNVKVYEDKATLDLKKSPSGISGSKTFKYALVPETPGHMAVPTVSLSYFDPKKGSYEAMSSSGFELAVVPGTQEKLNKALAARDIQATPVNPLAEDIATIHQEVRLQHEEPSFEFFYLTGVLFGAPPLIFAMSFMVIRRQRWKDEHVDLLKKKKALSRAVGRLKEIDLKKSDELPVNVSHIVKEYLGEKLGRVGTALTPVEVGEIFSKNGKRSEKGAALAQFLQDMDAFSYGGLPAEKGWEGSTVKKAIGLLKNVEKEL